MNDHDINVALDNAQAIVSRFCKPLETLPTVLLAVREGREELKTLDAQRSQLVKDIAAYQGQLKEEVEAGATKLETIQRNAAGMEETLNEQMRVAQETATAKLNTFKQTVRNAQEEFDRRMAEITNLRVTAERDLANLQTQIALAKNEYATFLKKIGGPV